MTGDDEQLVEQFRRAMRRVAATVNVISVNVHGRPLGITATAVSSLSMEPPSLLACINRAATMHGSIADVSHFGVNVLHAEQADLAQMFADSSRRALRFTAGWHLDCERPPRLAEAQAALLCRRIDHHQFGTHSIFIGVVEEAVVREEVDPLLYLNGQFGKAHFSLE